MNTFTTPYAILIAILLDWLLGDPRWLPHPVRGIGNFALWLEAKIRRASDSDTRARCKGTATALLVIFGTTGCTSLFLLGLQATHPPAATAGAVLLLYTTLAARDLIRHSGRVYEALHRQDLEEARHRVSYIVGRDTQTLDESGVTRATIESVAENTADGITGPLFYAILAGALLGPVAAATAAMTYKAINTLDSTFGYRNEQYLHFGRASARIDDMANWLPSRLTALAIILVAPLAGASPSGAWRIWQRDRNNHPSPNSCQCEAAMAGALWIELGGPAQYKGVLRDGRPVGDPAVPLRANHIRDANRLAIAAEMAFPLLLWGILSILERAFV